MYSCLKCETTFPDRCEDCSYVLKEVIPDDVLKEDEEAFNNFCNKYLFVEET